MHHVNIIQACSSTYDVRQRSFLLQNIINYNNELRIIDFGGSLGSTYFSSKTFFPKKINIKWSWMK